MKIMSILLATAMLFGIAPHLFAGELTIAFTGDTHAMLYPCSCPKEPDGGIARRATLIRQLRKKHKNLLLLDAGAFFAGGLQDEYTLNTDLDKERTSVNLAAMGQMSYDAAGISEDEFNFGSEFLSRKAADAGFPFLACNIESEKFSRFIVKDIGGIKVGITAVSPLSAGQKAGGLKLTEPKAAVKEVVAAMHKEGAGLIILLSNLSPGEHETLIKEVPGIDLLITGRSHTKGDYFDRVGDTMIMKPEWQGRKLGVAQLKLEPGRVVGHEVNEVRLSDKIKDDRKILSILPECFSEKDCRKKGFAGRCEEPATKDSRCAFTRQAQVAFKIITSKDCRVCNTDQIVDLLKKHFANLNISYIYYPGAKAEKLLAQLNVDTLPVYLLEKSADQEPGYKHLTDKLELKGDYYLLRPQFAGVSYFTQREETKGSLDLFISLYDKNSQSVLMSSREFEPRIHFLAVELPSGEFDAAAGKRESEEYMRSLCVKDHHPGLFWSYILCRAENADSSWWQECLEGADTALIESCAKSERAAVLLRDNIRLNRELKVMFGPTYLLDNREIFSSGGAVDKEDLRRIINKR
ncbi:hypothetical protein ACFL1K_03790 [Candidatus Omnitrophota bacterium]